MDRPKYYIPTAIRNRQLLITVLSGWALSWCYGLGSRLSNSHLLPDQTIWKSQWGYLSPSPENPAVKNPINMSIKTMNGGILCKFIYIYLLIKLWFKGYCAFDIFCCYAIIARNVNLIFYFIPFTALIWKLSINVAKFHHLCLLLSLF